MPASHEPVYSNLDCDDMELERERNRVTWGSIRKKPKYFLDASFSECCSSSNTHRPTKKLF